VPLQSPDETTAAASGPPPVVVVKSAVTTTFSHANGIAMGVRMLVIMPAGMVGVFFLLTVTREKVLSSEFWIMIVAQLVLICFVCGVIIARRAGNWRMDRAMHEANAGGVDHRDPAWIVKGVLLEVGGLCRVHWLTGQVRPKWRDRFQQLLRERGLPRALVIVQAELIDKVRTIPIDDRFVEPERLLGAMPRRSGTFWLLIVMILYFVWMLVNSALAGDWTMTAIFALWVAMMGVQLLRSWGIHLSQANAPVMGMGVISDHKGRRWSVRDSVVYLYPYFVAFIGPDGYHVLQFHGLDDPALRMFWQRWMHPHPRPDLA